MSSKPYTDGFDEDPDVDVRGDCPECSGTLETDGGERSCRECGLVVDERGLAYGERPRHFEDGPDTRRTGAPLTAARHDRGLSSEIGWKQDGRGKQLPRRKRRQLRRLRREHNRAKFQSKAERNLASACAEIARIVGALDLPRSVRESASHLFRRAQDADLLRGRSIEGFTAASVFATCRCTGFTRTVAEIDDVARCDESGLLHSYRVLNAELGLETNIQTPQMLLPTLASELGVDDVVALRARELTEQAEDEGLANGRCPSGVAAAALYVAGDEFDIGLTQKELTQAADVSAVTIRSRMKEMRALW